MSLYIFPDTTLLGTANTWTQGQSFIAASGSSVITIGNTGSSGTTCTITGQDFGGLPWLAINTGTNNLSFATITTGGAVPKQFTFTSDAAFGIQDASQTASLSVQLAANSSVTLTANRKLTFDVVNAARTIKLAGNLDIANNFTTAGNFPLTLTTTASTSVTLPTSGTLLTTSGSGSSLTFGTGTLSLAGNLTTSGAFATTLTVTGTTTVTLPTSGTLLTTTGSETVTGNIYTSGWLEAGRTSGSVALTTNDGYGNANIAFNHKSGTPDLTGNSGRITVNVDATSGVSMGFQLKSTTTLGVAVGLTQVLTLDELTATFATKTVSSGTVQGTQLISTIATGTAPLSVASTTQVANLNASQLAGNSVGTSGAAIPLCNTANTFSANNTFSGLNSTFGSNTGAATYGLGSGATLTATTKTINIGTSGVSGSITNINIGSQASNTTSTIYGNIIHLYDEPQGASPYSSAAHYFEPQSSSTAFGIANSPFAAGATFLGAGTVPYLWLSSGGNASSFVTIATANNTNNFSFASDGRLTLPKQLQFDAITDPAAPAAGRAYLYAKDVSGRVVPKWIGPSGIDYPLQTSFWQNNIIMWNPTTATAGVWLGTAGAGAGTYSTALPTDTNKYTSIKRGRWANVVTTLNQVLGQRNTEAMLFRGSGVSGAGGFFFYSRCGFDVWTNGGRFFAGMHSGTTVVSAEPSALNNTVGFCVDSADNGAISFLTRGTAATKASTGLTITSNNGYDLYIFCSPGSSQYTWRIVDIVTGTEASGTATATLPTNSTKLTAGVLASNASLTTVTSIQLGINKIYVETDY